MTHELAQRIFEAGDELGVEIQIRERYSGRHMYGDITTGIIYSDNSALLQSVSYAAAKMMEDRGYGHEFEEFMQAISNLKYDSMGKSTIAY